ncbi:hypothetical protein [Mycolicibacterium komossense]|uniref:Uncharacterized protein n=1 Tax=Mycolicibacterium komossense TaxID=1779 RepID=A0ABT3CJ57_9MYCO|nr:hypothetical protein [Mycolicibacterium komossense]MCV7229261.1 hypothetical protein [Mycolicibacterium komossense]
MTDLFDVEQTQESTHSRRMAAYQRAGVGLIYGDDGHWIADHLDDEEKVHAEAKADAAWALTHRHCARSGHTVDAPPGCFVRYRCPDCGQQVSLHPTGKVSAHAVRIAG